MLYPEGTKVVVKPDTIEEMTKGGLFVPDTVRDQHQHSVTRGVLIALGPSADVKFCEEGDFTGVSKREAVVGDRVMFVKFAGASLRLEEGRDRVEYRILQDADIVCYIDSDEVDNPDARVRLVK